MFVGLALCSQKILIEKHQPKFCPHCQLMNNSALHDAPKCPVIKHRSQSERKMYNRCECRLACAVKPESILCQNLQLAKSLNNHRTITLVWTLSDELPAHLELESPNALLVSTKQIIKNIFLIVCIPVFQSVLL